MCTWIILNSVELQLIALCGWSWEKTDDGCSIFDEIGWLSIAIVSNRFENFNINLCTQLKCSEAWKYSKWPSIVTSSPFRRPQWPMLHHLKMCAPTESSRCESKENGTSQTCRRLGLGLKNLFQVFRTKIRIDAN